METFKGFHLHEKNAERLSSCHSKGSHDDQQILVVSHLSPKMSTSNFSYCQVQYFSWSWVGKKYILTKMMPLQTYNLAHSYDLWEEFRCQPLLGLNDKLLNVLNNRLLLK